MKIEHLIYLKEIARTRSISAASKQLYIGQTTLSAIVKSVETELGVQIFQRTASGVSLTNDGEYILRESEGIIEKYNRVKNYSSRKDNSSQKIVFLADSPVCRLFCTEILDKFKRYQNFLTIQFQLCNSEKIIQELIQGTASLGAGFLNKDFQVPEILSLANANSVCMQKVKDEQMFLYTSKNRTDLAQQNVIDINTLHGEKYIHAGPLRAEMKDLPLYYFIQKQHFLSAIPDIQVAKKAALSHDAITLLFESSIIDDPDLLAGNAVAIPITGFFTDSPVCLYLFHNRAELLSSYEKEVINVFLSAAGSSDSIFL